MSSGMPAFTVVGLPDKAVAESRERVRAALVALGLSLPAKRITVNLAPADVLKEGSHFDLPIALGLLVAMGVLSAEDVEPYTALGELGLDGRLTPVAGVLPAAIGASSHDRGLICPQACGGEAAWAGRTRSWPRRRRQFRRLPDDADPRDAEGRSALLAEPNRLGRNRRAFGAADPPSHDQRHLRRWRAALAFPAAQERDDQQTDLNGTNLAATAGVFPGRLAWRPAADELSCGPDEWKKSQGRPGSEANRRARSQGMINFSSRPRAFRSIFGQSPSNSFANLTSIITVFEKSAYAVHLCSHTK